MVIEAWDEVKKILPKIVGDTLIFFNKEMEDKEVNDLTRRTKEETI